MTNERWTICRFEIRVHFVIAYLLVSVSLLTLTAISVERLLVLTLGLRYRQVVTPKRALHFGLSFWMVPTIPITMYFWSSLVTLWYGHVDLLLFFATSIFSLNKDFHQTLQSTNSSAKPCSNIDPGSSAEHSPIQKGGIYCIAVAAGICRLFHTKWYRGIFTIFASLA